MEVISRITGKQGINEQVTRKYIGVSEVAKNYWKM